MTQKKSSDDLAKAHKMASQSIEKVEENLNEIAKMDSPTLKFISKGAEYEHGISKKEMDRGKKAPLVLKPYKREWLMDNSPKDPTLMKQLEKLKELVTCIIKPTSEFSNILDITVGILPHDGLTSWYIPFNTVIAIPKWLHDHLAYNCNWVSLKVVEVEESKLAPLQPADKLVPDQIKSDFQVVAV